MISSTIEGSNSKPRINLRKRGSSQMQSADVNLQSPSSNYRYSIIKMTNDIEK